MPVLGFGALVGVIAHSSLKRRFPPLIVGGVVEFEETESGLVLVGLVGGAVLGGVLLGLPRVCSSWPEARAMAKGRLRWTERLGPSPVGILDPTLCKVPHGRYRPRMRGTDMVERERLLKLKGGFIPTVN